MRKPIKQAGVIAAGTLLLLWVSPSRADDIVSDKNVKQAITKACQYLYSIANEKGVWDPPVPPAFIRSAVRGKAARMKSLVEGNWGGKTALALNALAAAGQQRNPRFKKALKWLMKQDIVGTYALGMRMELIHRLQNSRAYRNVLKKDALLLLRSLRIRKRIGGGWDYAPPPNGRYGGSTFGDFSNTNYGVLGLWAAADEGLEIPARVWRILERTYINQQLKDGGWTYRLPHNHHGSYGAMTAAGIISLYLVVDHLYAGRGPLGSHRRSRAYKSIQRGIDWLAKNFSATENPGAYADLVEFVTYYFYNCERVAAAGGIKYFGKHDWFREMAATLLKAQRPNGAIPCKTSSGYGGVLVDTSYALLFLAKGSAPVIFNKLQHSGDWDNHLRELAALTDWLARQSERPTNWQVVNLQASAEDLTDSRILYIAGTKPLKFTDQERRKLKRFVQLGGLIVFHPDTASIGFKNSVKKLLAELWPKLELTKVDLSTHPLGKIYLPIRSRRIRIDQLASPTRVFAFFIHGSPANAWERRLYVTRRDAFALGADLHYFANDRMPMEKMPTKLTRFGEIFTKPSPSTNRTITLARIKYGDNPHRWDPEPLAFERFARLLAEKNKIKCDIKIITPEQLPSSGIKIAHLTGVDDPNFTPKQLDAIRTWLRTGGTLIIDQAGGTAQRGNKSTFDEAIHKIIADWFGEDALVPVLSTAPILKDLGKITYRHVLSVQRKKMHPKLKQVIYKNRPVIFYSKYDLTCGLLGNPNPLVSGVDPEDAFKLFSHLIISITERQK